MVTENALNHLLEKAGMSTTKYTCAADLSCIPNATTACAADSRCKAFASDSENKRCYFLLW